MGVLGNKLQKLQILLNEILCIMILPVFSQFLWNFEINFSGSHKRLSSVLITSMALEKCQKECDMG